MAPTPYFPWREKACYYVVPVNKALLSFVYSTDIPSFYEAGTLMRLKECDAVKSWHCSLL